MRRRELLQSAMVAGFLGRALAGSSGGAGFDRFGGWKGKKFEATGFFRVEKDGRWWMVSPEGHAFLSFGINHLYPHIVKQEYNRAAWEKRLGVDDLDGPKFQPAFQTWFLGVCRDYGFNTAGVHTALPIINTPAPSIPYMQPIRFVNIPHWRTDVGDANFLDVFSEEFAAHCDRLAKQTAAPAKDDPYLLGYSMTDCPLFTEEDCRERPDVVGGARRPARIGWPRRLRNLGAGAAGKHAYVRLMRDLYGGAIRGFNTTYGMEFDSFDALLAAKNWRPGTDLSNANETRDNVEFLKLTVEKYYSTALSAIRRYDPNHLFVGDKLNGNTDTVDTVLPVTSRYTDVIFYQTYARYEVQEPGLNRWRKVADKPAINGDSAYTMITEVMPRPYGPVADGIEQRAEWTEEFFRNAFVRPEFVGWHYCGLIDESQRQANKQDRQHSGLVDGYGKPYPRLQGVLRKCADEMYGIAETA